MRVFYTLGSGRSGTGFLAQLFGRNVRGCIARHEPPPGLYGNAVAHHEAGRDDLVDLMFRPKLEQIRQLELGGTAVYLESSHLFLKSFGVVAYKHVPHLELVHLVRNPLEVAKSHMNRGTRIPNPYTVGADLRIFAATGLELTDYQKYLVQWIEIENLAWDFVVRHGIGPRRRYALHTPTELNDPAALRRMFDHFGLETKGDLVLDGPRNENGVPTVVGPAEVAELAQVLAALPPHYTAIFKGEPYNGMDAPWLAHFRRR